MNKKIILLWYMLGFFFAVCVVWLPFFKNPALDLAEELAPLIVASIFVVAPFVITALWIQKKLKKEDEINRKYIYVAGIICVLIPYLILTSWFLYDAFARKYGGANIGAGILLLVASFIFPVIMIGTYEFLKKK